MISEEYRAQLFTPTIDSSPFWDGCNNEQLLLSHCKNCNRVFYYPRRQCPYCGSSSLDWQQSLGSGVIYSFSEVYTSFFGADWEDQLPYIVVLVDLAEGPRILSRLIDQPGIEPHIGDKVQLQFITVGTQKLPFFKLKKQNATQGDKS